MWPVASLAVALTGAGWLAAAAASGVRVPGASVAWLAPFGAGAAAGALLAAVAPLLARSLGIPTGTAGALAMAAGATRPLLLSWVVIVALLASPEANHWFVNWPRLRVAALALVWASTVASLGATVLRLFEHRRRWATRTVRRAGSTPLVIGGTLLVLVASGGGHLYTPDEWTIYAAAAGLANHGVPAAFADEPYPLHHLTGPIPASERAPDGSYQVAHSKFGVLTTILATPLYGLGKVAGMPTDLPAEAFPYGNRAYPLVPLVFNPVVVATASGLVFWAAQALGYGRRAALAAAGGFAFGSLAWPYSKTLMNMPLAAMLLAASFCACLRVGPRAGGTAVAGGAGGAPSAWSAAAGVLAGLAVATRYETLLFSAPLAALCVSRRRAPVDLMAFAAGGAAAIVPLVLGMNVLRTGNVLDFGYRGEGTLSSLADKPWYGLFGIVLSPGCGLVTYTPLMALGIVCLAWLWEDVPGPALAAGAIAVLGIAYYGSLTTWCGHTAWGPRYLLTVMPFMALPLAAGWHRLRRAGANPFVWLIGGGLFAWSAATNLLAVLIDFNRGWQDHWAHELTYLEVTWLPYFTGITSHLRLLREWLLDGTGGLDLYLVYAAGGYGWVLGAALAGTGVALLYLVWMAGDAGDARTAPAATLRGAGAAGRSAEPARAPRRSRSRQGQGAATPARR